MNKDFVYKLVDHRRRQFGKVRVLFRQCKELFGICGTFFKGRYLFFKLCNLRAQSFLFCFILRQQTIKAFI